MSEDCDFRVEVRNFRATDLTSRNRFRDKLKLKCEFDDKRFKTKKELIGGGDVQWKFQWKADYNIFSHKFLEERRFRVLCMRSKTEIYGTCSVNLYTCATGPQEHNLPLMNDDKVVGRLNFIVEMEHITNIALCFKQVQLRNLRPPPQHKECHPYLKYAYSKIWPLVLDSRAKATYSTTQYNTFDPVWTDLPEVRFHAGLKELLHESIVLHVTHNGKVHNTTLGRCNLLFRTLVDNGKTFKDEDLISFKGPLKVGDAEIEGVLIFKFLPIFAQMKAVNVVKKAIHTEKGIFDAVTLLPGLPVPNEPVFNSEETPETTVALPPGRGRASTMAGGHTEKPNWTNEPTEKEEKTEKSHEKPEKSPEKPKEVGQSAPVGEKTPKKVSKKKSVLGPAMTDDLIAFTPPAMRRQRSSSHSMAMPVSFDPFGGMDAFSQPKDGTPVTLNKPENAAFNPFAQQHAQQQQQQQQGTANPFATQQAAQAQQSAPSFNPFA